MFRVGSWSRNKRSEFIYSLFIDAFSEKSDYITSNGRMIGEYGLEKDLEGRGRGLI
jgi:hypothetical protein